MSFKEDAEDDISAVMSPLTLMNAPSADFRSERRLQWFSRRGGSPHAPRKASARNENQCGSGFYFKDKKVYRISA
ncbi:hypothetical protein C7437_11029 [Psychrobacillus insolitus]|uniref:Uncharacterized protein n=1 Tax=Psychrobacillus insolitus TaxID=1461 RepID=A0A2W7MCI1_9BACI|nr:hypothetical protein C7437_11029 [Psychrobacillus insolitus]